MDGGVRADASEGAAVLEQTSESTELRAAEGWFLGQDTYLFHRAFFRRVGRVAFHSEYTSLIWQIRRGQGALVAKHCFSVLTVDGQSIVVSGGRRVLQDVKPADWQPPAAKPGGKRDAPRPVKASTLTLGGAAKDKAARVLTPHLARIGIARQEVIRSNKSARR